MPFFHGNEEFVDILHKINNFPLRTPLKQLQTSNFFFFALSGLLAYLDYPRLPFEKKLLPTGIIILRNYLEIGNALPYRKNCFQELFGSVIPIKSVMAIAAGNFFGGFSALRPSPPSNGGQSVIRARACTLSRENSLFRLQN